MGRTHLSEIELGILFAGYTLDLDERSVGTGVALSALVSNNTALAI